MQIDHTRLYGFKTLKKEEWDQLNTTSLEGSLGSRPGSKVGLKTGITGAHSSLTDFVGHRLGNRVGVSK